MKRLLALLLLSMALALPAPAQTPKPRKPVTVRVLRGIGRGVWKVVKWPVGMAMRMLVDGEGNEYGGTQKGQKR